MPSYAAVLRECADTLAQSDGSLARVRKAEQLNSLADLLERVTPEAVNAVAADLDDLRYTLPAVAHRNRELVAAIRALAAGPQGEA